MKKGWKGVVWVLFLLVLLLAVPRISGRVADLFDYRGLDPDGAYAWISVHHIVQALMFIGIILVLKRFTPLNFGFDWGDKTVGRRYVVRFTLIFAVGSVVSHFLAVLTRSFQPFPYPLTAGNILGQLGFQLLLSGPSEELIFRAFAITMLALCVKGRVFGGKVSMANIIAAVIFGMAHMRFSFAPFTVSYNMYQVLMSVTLGLFYGDCYEKSKSMVYPMMMHSISNIVMVGMTVVLSFVVNP